MQRPIGERIKELDAAEQERRIQRLQEILDELMSLTDWKKP